MPIGSIELAEPTPQLQQDTIPILEISRKCTKQIKYIFKKIEKAEMESRPFEGEMSSELEN